MSGPDFDPTARPHDREFWEERWAEVLGDRGDQVAARPPNERLTDAVGSLSPGRALDAGCGHGSDALWLAARGWSVTAVDFSSAALARGRETARAAGPRIDERIEWIEADLSAWAPAASHYDLVASMYVHIEGQVGDWVRRFAAGVAPGGSLFLVGHRPIDPATGERTAAADQVQVSVEAAARALDPAGWAVLVAEERPRAAAGSGVDAVVHARRVG